MRHNPVLLQEVLESLNLKPGSTVVDGTVGSGGHAAAILQKIGKTGRLIGLDQDPDAIGRCRELFEGCGNVTLIHENFRDLGKALQDSGVDKIDVALLDVGLSSEQLADGKRGFSFQVKGDLDMRMNPEVGLKVSELLATISENELADLLFQYGEEKRSRRIARQIVETRKHHSLKTTTDLVCAIDQALFARMPFKKTNRPVWLKRHPATKVFQALRIAVNDELGTLRKGIFAAWECLKSGGRLGVISFHSLEDRIVKHQFQDWVRAGQGKLIFRKPVVAKRSEILNNPRSRSAKLRVIEKKS